MACSGRQHGTQPFLAGSLRRYVPSFHIIIYLICTTPHTFLLFYCTALPRIPRSLIILQLRTQEKHPDFHFLQLILSIFLELRAPYDARMDSPKKTGSPTEGEKHTKMTTPLDQSVAAELSAQQHINEVQVTIKFGPI